jgi:hypothetical protein
MFITFTAYMQWYMFVLKNYSSDGGTYFTSFKVFAIPHPMHAIEATAVAAADIIKHVHNPTQAHIEVIIQ